MIKKTRLSCFNVNPGKVFKAQVKPKLQPQMAELSPISKFSRAQAQPSPYLTEISIILHFIHPSPPPQLW